MYLQKLPEYQDKLARGEAASTPFNELNQNEEKVKFVERTESSSLIGVISDFSNGIAIYMFCVFFCFTVTLGKLRRRFFRTNPLLYHKFENMVIFRSGNLYSL